MFFDSSYLMCVFVPTLLISLGVQLYLKSTYAKWSKVRNSSGVTGYQTAQALFQRTNLQPVPLERVAGDLSDHFDPGKNIVRLSEGTASAPSVASMAVAAHELGHVQQYQTGSGLILARNFLMPAVQFSPTVSYIAIMLGFYFNIVGLIWVGVLFFGLMVMFSILTLPVEIDASRRAIAMLDESGLIRDPSDRQGAKAVLTAAALTYLGAAVTSVLTLLYYVSLANRRR
jgi:Zn-dependent membrane protease YugP